MKGPLSGYKIIEFATYVAAPSGVRILADWGAEVIKIEGPSGDDYRTNWNVYCMPGESDLYNPCFDLVGVNKRFMVVDLRTDEGREILYKLLEDAQAFVTSARDKRSKSLAVIGRRCMRSFLGWFMDMCVGTVKTARYAICLDMITLPIMPAQG